MKSHISKKEQVLCIAKFNFLCRRQKAKLFKMHLIPVYILCHPLILLLIFLHTNNYEHYVNN